MAAFKCQVSESCQLDAEHYRYSLQFTAGDANKLFNGCFNHRYNNLSYAEGIRRLQKHYGDRYRLAKHYVQKLQSWPAIKGNDARAASELSKFLTEPKIARVFYAGTTSEPQNESGVFVKLKLKLIDSELIVGRIPAKLN